MEAASKEKDVFSFDELSPDEGDNEECNEGMLHSYLCFIYFYLFQNELCI